MHDLAIKELKKDWKHHVTQASAGDVRSAYAVSETLQRLDELGCDFFWLKWARSCGPAMPMGKEIT